jgi:hypothetical protein
MAYNTILIKRRTSGDAGAPVSLSGGELAFNEVDSTLYYGASSGVISIAGDGAFVNRTTDQTISGDKTFVGSTTLSSTTFSSSSLIDAGGNKITNLAAPTLSGDATTKQYVDDVSNTSSTATDNLSTEVYNTFVKLTDDRAVDLNGGLDVTGGVLVDTLDTTGDASIGGHLTVTGNLSVLGTQTVVNTETINISGTSTQIDVVNNGTATGVTVNQTGDQNVAEFYDDGNISLAIIDGGNVGIGTLTPNEKLTVTGNISATGTIYSDGGMEISSGGATTLYVEDGKVGINTETPNEAFTVVGSVSATLDIYARNADFTGTLDADGATTLGSTLYVTNAATFASSVSAAGALTVDGTTTLNDDLTVTDVITVNSSTNLDTVTIDGTNKYVSIYDNATGNIADYQINGVSVAGTGFTIATDTDSGEGINLTPYTGSHTNVTQGNLKGNGSNYIEDFIVDGGTF